MDSACGLQSKNLDIQEKWTSAEPTGCSWYSFSHIPIVSPMFGMARGLLADMPLQQLIPSERTEILEEVLLGCFQHLAGAMSRHAEYSLCLNLLPHIKHF